MVGVSQWADIESAPASHRARRSTATADARSATTNAAARRRRLKPLERPTVAAIDVAGQIMQRNGRAVIVGSAILMVPMLALNMLVARLVYRTSDGGSVVPSLPDALGGIDASAGSETMVRFIAAITASITAAWVGAFVCSLALGHQLGADVSPRRAMTTAVRRLPAVTGAWLIGHWWAWPASWIVANTTTETAWTLVAFCAVLIIWPLSTLTVYVVPVMVGEHLGLGAGLRRGIGLARGRFTMAASFVAFTGALGLSLRLAIGWVPDLAEQTGLVTFGQWRSTISGLAAQIGLLIALPLIAVATSVMYLQTRVHAEGLDLQLAAADAFGSGTP
jgi:hypothetical protein